MVVSSSPTPGLKMDFGVGSANMYLKQADGQRAVTQTDRRE